jgi:GSH-dependent disulfide-bond oxidoreductase
MIDLHYWTTPNGHKITIALEENGTPYRIVPVNMSAGEQLAPSFLRISPNNRIPAIVDHAPEDGDGPPAVFESGAILEYLADKTGKFLSSARRARFGTLQWLYWQMAGLGPMAGENHHFAHYARERIPYAWDRYAKETNRLYSVLDRRLRDRPFVAGAYSIADIACYPWIRLHERQGQNLAEFPAIARSFALLSERPAVRRAYEIAANINRAPTVTEQAKRHLFGQTAAVTGEN